MLKVDLHLHSGEDKHHKLKYNAKDLIDRAVEKGFEVLAFTFHSQFFYPKKIVDYAKKKGVLLISGTELMIEGKEVLIYNLTEKEMKAIKSFDDLRALKKKKDILVIAPHPYFPRSECLHKKLEENIDLFDGIEYCHFYFTFMNFNRKALIVAKKHNLAIVGNSDAHRLEQIGMTYAIIDAKKDIKSIFSAIRNGKVKLATKAPNWNYMFLRLIDVLLGRE